MRMRFRSKVTRKGQITITAEARRQTGIKLGDPVDLVVEDGRIVGVEPAGNWAERTAGIIKYDGPPLTERELKDATAQAIADSVMERAKKQQSY